MPVESIALWWAMASLTLAAVALFALALGGPPAPFEFRGRHLVLVLAGPLTFAAVYLYCLGRLAGLVWAAVRRGW